jgi:hypothetical protein
VVRRSRWTRVLFAGTLGGRLMPLSRIEIEEIGPGRWVAEVEAGGTSAVRRNVRATSFDDVMMAVVEAHAELTAPPAVKVPRPPAEDLMAHKAEETAGYVAAVRAPAGAATPSPPVLSVREMDGLQSERIVREVEAQQKAENAVYEMPSREELLAEADRLGVDVDRRWGATRLQEAIDAAKGDGEMA